MTTDENCRVLRQRARARITMAHYCKRGSKLQRAATRLWNTVPLKPWFCSSNPFASATKFATVFGATLPKSPNVMRPIDFPFMEISKNTVSAKAKMKFSFLFQ